MTRVESTQTYRGQMVNYSNINATGLASVGHEPMMFFYIVGVIILVGFIVGVIYTIYMVMS